MSRGAASVFRTADGLQWKSLVVSLTDLPTGKYPNKVHSGVAVQTAAMSCMQPGTGFLEISELAFYAKVSYT